MKLGTPVKLDSRKAFLNQNIDDLHSYLDDEQIRDLANFEILVEKELGELKLELLKCSSSRLSNLYTKRTLEISNRKKRNLETEGRKLIKLNKDSYSVALDCELLQEAK